ncbi:PTS system D-fructose-specific IIA component (F1P-forming), Frc family /PTS system D-fructose-specific IIB component (F1P-forming), Frc family /PTS system D-fructose-specific IIC component (F1P-forming), Frc family [Marinilactibacillus piezotolerans]|uniref:PTS system D-fructose-specific IIA component (F1P-forming), Frc family /PTS system D-fructose-specific IIB component (F1P-forming), Frc family /PTS system D-fructose-specific IIC component (F1P-for... n=1 Tax=Marinilactibacillus piezotolerans TaxID=258723 RepID=A0A1I3XHP2_9LACT|nr:fructose-specific PTS transporter subunit EIIC [Marinilactibacillus piezotolerans]SFK19022.1 PTS system D-fructose-specific IIA component (F1P-forming), Frc family /PTS system D-fructose-specific IIB component (F1P-forming), Frc family /PTS system D-fructose-specific IIC component (F1P-forming), Frc family [Marinilactibacillus piezotolerans]
MQINDLLRKDLMILDLQATEKEAAIDEMIERLAEKDVISDKETYKEGIMQREAQTSTGLGDGVAMPHSKNKAVKEPAVLFAKSSKGVDYESLDGQPTHYLFMIAAPEGGNDLHLQVLASLSRKLVNPEVLEQLDQATTPEDVQTIFAESEEDTKEVTPSTDSDSANKKFVVAVTACPTGIAHTYMAEDALKRKADEMGVTIRVETNGSDGAKNQLTADEIRRADGVIIAADKKVELARFNGKHVLQRPVAEGINKAEELITKAMNQQAPVLRVDGDAVDNNASEEEGGSAWNTLYKDLMNGISHMLPFVVGGGIIMAISFMFDRIPMDNNFLFDSFNTIGSSAFQFLIPILAGYIAYSIADRPGLLPGMTAGIMAVDSNAGFLGGLIGGFVAGYVMNLIKKSLRGVPKSFEGLKSILMYPVLGLLATGLLMFFIISPVFSTINTAMISFLENLGTGNAVLLGAVLGGMMAIDMGGPFNKAAYTFSIGIFTDTGDGSLMAAVMMGGMIPPLAIALATVLFKNKFTDVERQSGLSNFVLGLSFITEGAIPFAAADPMRVIGSSVIGAAVGGGLSQLWNTAIPAPHGGIFVVGLGDNILLFLLALVIGTIISAIILGFWKPEVKNEVKV